jgi:hypothetical protein
MPGRSFAREPLEPTSTAFPGDDGGDTLQTIINSEVKGSSLVLVVPRPREFPSSHASGSPSKKRISSLAYLYAHKLRDEPVAL